MCTNGSGTVQNVRGKKKKRPIYQETFWTAVMVV